MVSNFLVLEDGTVLKGESFGYEGDSYGEVVFTTDMNGYQEALTDPSNCGHLLVFTYPLVGNYGVNERFNQSDNVHARGVIVKEYCKNPSVSYGGIPLSQFLIDHKVPAISGIDTRELVVKIRNNGTLKGAIVFSEHEIDDIIVKLGTMADVNDENLVSKVSTKEIYEIDSGKDVTIGIIDCGVTQTLLNDVKVRANVVVFPYDTSVTTIIHAGIDGVVVTNGPGNPASPSMTNTVVKTVKKLASKMPILGISFGGQIIAIAFGATTRKLKFGHRGSNQPIRFGKRIYITSQNHGYTIDKSSIESTELEVSEVNINDGSVEGIRHRLLPIFGTEYITDEFSSDGKYLLDIFIEKIRSAMQ
ncbi:MAG: glutamine-hydrolyzing carbamoyl-phosphate synthase small subunit [archaeon]|nr:glutamine-hydrolyzing carbamoyl-phosphate synthase small subunit [archaeon]